MKTSRKPFCFSLKLACLLVFISIAFDCLALDYNVTFTASGASSSVDSVIVQNLTKGIQKTVLAGNVLNLTDVLNSTNTVNGYSAVINITPNPIRSSSTLSFDAPSNGVVKLNIYTPDGKSVASKTLDIREGKNTFTLTLPAGLFHIHVIGNGYNWHSMAISQTSGKCKPQIEFAGYSGSPQRSKAVSVDKITMLYSAGDQLIYKAKSGNYTAIITDMPIEGKTINFVFADSNDENNNHYAVSMPMTMFRMYALIDSIACKVINTNDMYLTWFGVEGASGYRIQIKRNPGVWTAPLFDTIVGPNVLKMIIPDLQYSNIFSFAIQALSPKGAEYHSLWYGYGQPGYNNNHCEYTMGKRDSIPDVVSIASVTKTSMRVCFDLKVPTTLLVPGYKFEQENGYFVMDQIKVEPSITNPGLETKIVNLTSQDKANGYVDITGLTPNAVYITNGMNNRLKRYWDRSYNTQVIRMKGDPTVPILIKHVVDTSALAIQYQASRLDTILNKYMSDNTLAEGTIFQLEAGKNYYFGSTVLMSKGFSLVSASATQRAQVLLGLGYNASNDANSFNFSFGWNAIPGEIGSINIQSIIFDGINFDAPFARNYLVNQSATGKTSGTGNYFVNQSSSAIPYVCESFEVRNCDFRRIIRGWVRIQGPNRKVIEKIVVDNCMFYDMGFYDNNGNGYSYISGDGTNDKSNIFNDVTVKNCSFIDSPLAQFMNEAANRAWPATTKWNITLENNTFLNFNTRASGCKIFNMRYNPANSKFTVKRNLFILTKADGDARTMYMSGMDIRNYNGVTFDITENYSTNANLTSSQIFTSNAFNSISQGAGYNGGVLNVGGLEETKIKLGINSISPTDLMDDPNPIAITGVDMHKHNLDGLYLKNTDAVKNHEIYKNNIGDPRWRKKVNP